MLKRFSSPTGIGCPKRIMSIGKNAKLLLSSKDSKTNDVNECIRDVILTTLVALVKTNIAGPIMCMEPAM